MKFKVISLISAFLLGLAGASQPVGRIEATQDNYNNNNYLDATTYYAEYDKGGFLQGRKTNIMQKLYNREPERITSFDGKIDNYEVSPDRRYIAAYQNNYPLRSVDTYNGQSIDLFKPQRSVWGMTYSPDSTRMIASEQGKNNNYYLHNYNLQNRQDNVFYSGNTNSRFYPYAWRPDNIIIFIELKSGNENVWYYDMNNNNFSQTGYTNPYWISGDGRYMAMASDYQKRKGSSHRVYNNNDDRGYSDNCNSYFQIYDPVTSRYYGNFGNNSYNNQITGYYPDQNELLYQSYKSNKNQASYYSYSMNNDQSYMLNNPYDFINRWNDNSYLGTNTMTRNGSYNITSGNNIIISSKNPIRVIICFSSDYYRNIPANAYQGNNDYGQNSRVVSIRGNAYNPSTISVNAGDTVRWVNYDNTPHTVTSMNGAFDSGNIAPGGSYTHSFTGSGSYQYYCRIHPEMRGNIGTGGNYFPGPSANYNNYNNYNNY